MASKFEKLSKSIQKKQGISANRADAAEKARVGMERRISKA